MNSDKKEKFRIDVDIVPRVQSFFICLSTLNSSSKRISSQVITNVPSISGYETISKSEVISVFTVAFVILEAGKQCFKLSVSYRSFAESSELLRTKSLLCGIRIEMILFRNNYVHGELAEADRILSCISTTISDNNSAH